MKKLTELNNLHDVFVNTINELNNKLLNHIKIVKKEHNQQLIDEKIKLLMAICTNENLDFNVMKTKYLSLREQTYVVDVPVISDSKPDDDILNKIEINEKEYYYKQEDGSKIFDLNLKPVGTYTKGNFILD